ncbi:MAG: chemotaxis protein CheA, partial [Campylobacterales bacterium]|nr:chemotaxis protein CheA [Campylobacterales bacterium]
NNQTNKNNHVEESSQESFAHESKLWHISLRLHESFMYSGMDLLSLLKFFLKLGEVQLVTPVLTNLPSFEDLDPTIIYMGFEIDFETSSSKDDIVEIFEFVEDDIDLVVFEHNDYEALNTLVQSREIGLKQVLIDSFSYEQSCFENNITINKEQPVDLKERTQKQTQSIPLEVIPPHTLNSVQNKTQSLTKSNIQKDSFFLKVNSKKIDNLINQVGELVVKNSQLSLLAEQLQNEELFELLESMQLLLDNVRDEVMNVRMVPVKESFSKYRRIVNDTASKLGKDIEFILEGEDTELDKSLVEKLTDPLTHIIRNSIDHGIETKEKRVQNGKNPKGKVVLRAFTDSGMIVLQIQDDGAGINTDRIYQKAIEKNIITSQSNLSKKEIYNLIFMPGFSTASAITDISGRGVGMDVVKRNIEELRGIIDIESQLGHGTILTIKLPLTLAIIDGFLLQSGHQKYIIPLEMIEQCYELTDELKSTLNYAQVINLRGEVIPLLNLREFFQDPITPDELENEDYRPNIVIVKIGINKVAILVDELFGQQQIVVKSLGPISKNVPGISGGTILGDSQIALILDIPKLIEYKVNSNKEK